MRLLERAVRCDAMPGKDKNLRLVEQDRNKYDADKSDNADDSANQSGGAWLSCIAYTIRQERLGMSRHRRNANLCLSVS